MEKNPVRVLVVDDFQPFRDFIRSLLQQRPEFVLVDEVSDGLEAVRLAEELQPGVVFLDIGLPGLDGFQAARQIRSVAPVSRIVFITLQRIPEIVREAFRLGARGYVLKTDALELLTAADAVLDGKKFVSSSLIADHPVLPDSD
jgi:DNA-binding NarL/FixJ family response regulator